MNNSLIIEYSTLPMHSRNSYPGKQEIMTGWGWVCDKNGMILECDERVTESVGYSSTYLLNKSLNSLIVDKGSQKAMEIALKAKSFPFTVQVKMESLMGYPVEVVFRFLGFREEMNANGRLESEYFGVSYMVCKPIKKNFDKHRNNATLEPELYPTSKKSFDKDEPYRNPFNQQDGTAHNKSSKDTSLIWEKRQKNLSKIEKNHKSAVNFFWMALPLIIFIGFGFGLYIERKGPSYRSEATGLYFLESFENTELSPASIKYDDECLLLYDSEGIEGPMLFENMSYTLNSMRVNFRAVDVVSDEEYKNFDSYRSIVIAFTDLEKISEHSLELMEWVENGGKLLFAIRPDPSSTFTSIYRKLGILSKFDDFQTVTGLEFKIDIIPGAKSISLADDFLHHSSLIVELENQSNVYITSADRYQLPILWGYDIGEGRVVFINTDQFTMKIARGTLAAAYSLLYDVFVYPVINSSIFFIDDFPAPIPQGKNVLITQEFGRDLQSFYINVWWPDMQSLSRRFGLKYTGVVIETYDEDVDPPLESQKELDLFSYFGISLLQDDGEIGYHGYNHVPLCLSKAECDNQLGYPYWPSDEAMLVSLKKLEVFNNVLFRDETFSTYVPPSNIIGTRARELLPAVLPEIKVVASVYFPDVEDNAYVQEFEEAEDGIIELPRITSGYNLNDFTRWAALNELGMHYIQAHFVHPDDVLDEIRSQGNLWSSLRKNIEDHFLWLVSSNPHIRHMTAREGAMAVQRYARLNVDRAFEDRNYQINLDNFYDQGWLIMRSKYPLDTIEGGVIEDLGSDLYLIHAENSEITIQFKD